MLSQLQQLLASHFGAQDFLTFCSTKFLYFFVVIFVVYWAMPWQRARVWLLLLASLYFYACWSWKLALLIGACTALDYLIARGLDAFRSQTLRRCLLLASLVGNLGLLVY